MVTREEAIVQIGVDQKAVIEGMTGVSAILHQFSRKRKSDEESYTDWWKSELDKRAKLETEASVEQARRNNLARKLRREREEERSKPGGTFIPWQERGEADGNLYTQGFTHKLTKFFTIGFGAGIAVQAISMVTEALKGLVIYFTTEYAKMWYGDSEQLTKWSERLEASTKKLRELRKELDDSASQLGEAMLKRAVSHNDENTLFAQLKATEKKTEAARVELALQKEFAASQSAGPSKALAIENAAIAETELNKSLKEEYDLHEKIDEVQGRAAEKREQERKKAEQDEKDWQAKLKASREHQRAQDADILSDRLQRSSNRRKDLEGFMPSLQELASSGRFWGAPNSTQGFGFQAGPFAGMAQSILNLGHRAEQQLIWGNVAGARASIEERNRRYDQLAKAGIIPQRAELVADAQIQTANILEEIKSGDITLQTALQLVKD